MTAPTDLTGRRFGRLTVLELDPVPYISPNSHKRFRRWRCRCDCGTELTVLQSLLTRKNGTKSCGCAQSDAAQNHADDLTGCVFGRLKVIRKVPLDNPLPNGVINGWLCECECGTRKVYTQKELCSNHVQSCGCLLRDTAVQKLADNVLGRYDGTMISKLQSRDPTAANKSGTRGVYWSKRDNRWIAKIGLQGREIYIGRFQELSDAVRARKAAEEKYYTPIIEAYNKSKNSPED